MPKSKLSFHGGVGAVTGSNFALEIPEAGQLMVDCGLFQGGGPAYEKNRAPFPYDPKSFGALLVTHAHIDHIGRIPKLVKEGFSGRIVSTPQTKEIASIMFDDALKIMEEDTKRHGGGQPMYSRDDISKTLSLWETKKYHEAFEIFSSVHGEFLDAGHILGSAMIKLTRNGRTIIFSGDVGNSPSPIVRDTESVAGATYLVLDSTYGDRTHQTREQAEQKFADIVARVIQERGTLLLPAFSLERAHIILYILNDLVESGKIKPVPVYLDSPMASRLTPIYQSSREIFNEEAKGKMDKGDDIFSFPKLTIVANNFESDGLEKTSNPKIIIAGSGMSVGGRIPTHEIKLLPEADTTLLITGYQSFGTLGRAISEGEKTVVINKEKVTVRAKIENIEGFSAHKDLPALVDFVEKGSSTLQKIFIVHGELKSSLFLVQRIRDYLGLDALCPEKDEKYEIEF